MYFFQLPLVTGKTYPLRKMAFVFCFEPYLTINTDKQFFVDFNICNKVFNLGNILILFFYFTDTSQKTAPAEKYDF